MLNCHCACAISRDMYRMKNLSTLFQFLTPLCLFTMWLSLGSYVLSLDL